MTHDTRRCGRVVTLSYVLPARRRAKKKKTKLDSLEASLVPGIVQREFTLKQKADCSIGRTKQPINKRVIDW